MQYPTEFENWYVQLSERELELLGYFNKDHLKHLAFMAWNAGRNYGFASVFDSYVQTDNEVLNRKFM
jgi:hypothetical protein